MGVAWSDCNGMMVVVAVAQDESDDIGHVGRDKGGRGCDSNC